MKQVVAYLELDAHAALKQRAKANRRSMGAQLVWEALNFRGITTPSPTPRPRRPVKGGAK